jgi:heme-binding protein
VVLAARLLYLTGMQSRLRRWVRRIAITLGVLGVLFGLMQAVPYGRTHSNPKTVLEPAWDSPRTRELAVRACFDCHSNQTTWPWYADVAPMSWVVENDVDGARDTLNFSEWQRAYPLAQESGPSVVRRDMPPYKYRMAHPLADLTEAETIELARGLNATVGARGKI